MVPLGAAGQHPLAQLLQRLLVERHADSLAVRAAAPPERSLGYARRRPRPDGSDRRPVSPVPDQRRPHQTERRLREHRDAGRGPAYSRASSTSSRCATGRRPGLETPRRRRSPPARAPRAPGTPGHRVHRQPSSVTSPYGRHAAVHAGSSPSAIMPRTAPDRSYGDCGDAGSQLIARHDQPGRGPARSTPEAAPPDDLLGERAARSARARSMPVSMPMSCSMCTTSSVATLPVAPGAYGQPPRPPTLASNSVTPELQRGQDVGQRRYPGCCGSAAAPAGRAAGPGPRSAASRTRRGVAMPVVSPNAIRSAPSATTRSTMPATRLGSMSPSNGQPKLVAMITSAVAPAPCSRSISPAMSSSDSSVRAVDVAPVVRVAGRDDHLDLGEAGGQRPLGAPGVRHQRRVAHARRPWPPRPTPRRRRPSAGSPSGARTRPPRCAARRCRTARRAADLGVGRDRVLVLQAVARSDLADRDVSGSSHQRSPRCRSDDRCSAARHPGRAQRIRPTMPVS